jgi:predicted small secreted protein
MLGTIVYSIVLLVITYTCWRIFKNIKVILMIGIALVCGYFLTNYCMKDKNLTDQNILNKTDSFIKRGNKFLDGVEKWDTDLRKELIKDPYVDTSKVYKRMIERSAEASREAYANMEKEAERRREEDAKSTAILKALRDAGVRRIYGNQ